MEVRDSEMFDGYEGNDSDIHDEISDDFMGEDGSLYDEMFDDYEEWGLDVYDEVFQKMADMEIIKHENEVRNIHRDKRGRLNKGALLASKYNCNKEDILRMYDSGMTVKQIVECMGCSKSAVYNATKVRRKKKK